MHFPFFRVQIMLSVILLLTLGQTNVLGDKLDMGGMGDFARSGANMGNDTAISGTADFKADTTEYTLIYNANPGGSISGSAFQIVQSGSDGQPVTAEPDTGYVFEWWSDGVQTATRTDTNVTDDIFVFASFSPQEYSLNYSAGTGGSISGPAFQNVDFGSDGEPVTAEPDTGYVFH
ncbi:MAG: hypothetical protein JJU11_01305 [Candidatus Sumerlaeia bacterium]|nr:hypothetical protein [Candidatus Sumerlaeia bacterium]